MRTVDCPRPVEPRRLLAFALMVGLLLSPASVNAQEPVRTWPALQVIPLSEAPLEVPAGGAGTMAMRIVNAAGFERTIAFSLDMQATEGPPIELSGTLDKTSATLAPGASVDVTIVVEASADALAGNTTALLRIQDQGYMTDARIPIVVFVESTPAALEASATQGSLAMAVAAALAGGALVAIAFWRRAEWLRYAALSALLPLYSRLAPTRLLDQERREAIYRAIQEEPGIHFAALLQRTGLASGVATYHVRLLERYNLVKSHRDGPLRRFTPALVAMPPRPPAPITPMQQRVLDLLASGPLTQREIAERLGVSQQGANRHVKALERRGALAIRYDSGAWFCHALPNASSPTTPAPSSSVA